MPNLFRTFTGSVLLTAGQTLTTAGISGNHVLRVSRLNGPVTIIASGSRQEYIK